MTDFSPIRIAQDESQRLQHGYQVGVPGDLHLCGPRLGNRTINIFMGGNRTSSSGWSWGGFFGAAAGSFARNTLNFLTLGFASKLYNRYYNMNSGWLNTCSTFPRSYTPQYGAAGNIFGYGYDRSYDRPSILNGTRVFGYYPTTDINPAAQPPTRATEPVAPTAPAAQPPTRPATQTTQTISNASASAATTTRSDNDGNQITAAKLLTALRKEGMEAIGTHGSNEPIKGKVTLGNIKGENNDLKSDSGWPIVFTVTDTTSNKDGNKYVFQFVKVNDGKPVYKVLPENDVQNNKGKSMIDESKGDYDYLQGNNFVIDDINENEITMHTEDDGPTSRKKTS